MTTTQITIRGIAEPVQKRRDGFRVYVYTYGNPSCIYMDAPTKSKLRRRLRERGATEQMLREAGLFCAGL